MNNDSLSALESRIQRLEDTEAIRQLKARYFHACDRKSIDVLTECFAEGDIDIDYGAIGKFNSRDDFIQVFKQMACHDHIIDMHHGQNAQIEILSTTTAKAIFDLYFYQINSQQNTLTQLAGYYNDFYIKQGNYWKIKSTHFIVTSSLASQIDNSSLSVLFAGSEPPAL